MQPPATVSADIRHPPWLFYAAGAVALAVIVMIALGTTVARGHGAAIDRAILLALRPAPLAAGAHASAGFRQMMIDITALGGGTVLTIFVAAASGFLAFRRHWLTLALVLGGTISGSLAVGMFKTLVGRPRPTLVDHLVDAWSASFPSGHAANSATVYLTLALLLMQIVEDQVARWYLLGAAVLLVMMIGISRVYLGVHWPSDVLAGWSFGTLWALAWWSLGGWLRIRRAQAAPTLP